MKVPISWLRNVIQNGAPEWNPSVETIKQTLIDIGHEVNKIISLGPTSGSLVIGQIVEIKKLDTFEKSIKIYKVDIGCKNIDGLPISIVCSANGIEIGSLVVVALPGTIMSNNHTVIKRKVFGIISNGVICSPANINFGVEHSSNILTFPEGTATPGDSAIELLGLNDKVFHIDITPDRGYCLSIRGLAREIACAHNLNFTDPANIKPIISNKCKNWPINVEPGTGLLRLGLCSIKNISPKISSPWWIQRRLMLSGIKITSPILDIANYVMVELGHPVQVYDSDLINKNLTVRFAYANEKIVTLDCIKYNLYATDVLLVDDKSILSIGGIISSKIARVNNNTTNILLESAVWDQAKVSRTQRRLHLFSESAKRYERSIDANISISALNRYVNLITNISKECVTYKFTDWRAKEYSNYNYPTIIISPKLPDSIAGVQYPKGTTLRRLLQIGAKIEGLDPLFVTPPSWRPDICQSADLAEEVIRFEGIDLIPSLLPRIKAGYGLTKAQKLRRAVSKSLALSGFVEILPTPFLNQRIFDLWDLAKDDPRRNTVKLLNPIEHTKTQLTTTLLPSLLETLVYNISRGNRNFCLFAIQQVMIPRTKKSNNKLLNNEKFTSTLTNIGENLPYQPKYLAAVLSGIRNITGSCLSGHITEAIDAFEAVKLISQTTGIKFSLKKSNKLPWHPGRCAEISLTNSNQKLVIGYAGQMHPKIVDLMDLPKSTCVFELNLDLLSKNEQVSIPYISPFPSVFQDLSLIVPSNVPISSLIDTIYEGCGNLLEEVRLFDVYTDFKIGKGFKSVSFTLSFRSSDRTLTEYEASTSCASAIRLTNKRFGAAMRK